MPKINFQINPKAYYAAIAYSYLAGLNPKNFLREAGEIDFTYDRNNSPESQHIEDFLSRDTKRTVPAMETVYAQVFLIYSSFVDALEKRLQSEKRVEKLSLLLDEILCQ